MKSFRLPKEEATTLAKKYPTPFTVLSLSTIEENYNLLREKLPRVKIHYAMKANPQPNILHRLASLGASFDVASVGEIEQLTSLGIDGSQMIYANPVKPLRSIEYASSVGVDLYTFDDESELPKIWQATRGTSVLVRLKIENDDALVELNDKFGVTADKIVPLLKKAQSYGLDPAGICFHVGSQSFSESAYKKTFELCRRLFDEAEKEGLKLRILDIGGGFPIPFPGSDKQIDTVAILEEINEDLERLFPETQILAEPGRFICGTAVCLVTSVIGTKRLDGEMRYFLDEGLYGVFSGAMYDHWVFDFITFKDGEKKLSTLLGPSCDSIDFIRRGIMLPELEIGDILVVPDCGAYTSVSATTFNGFPKAPTVVSLGS